MTTKSPPTQVAPMRQAIEQLIAENEKKIGEIYGNPYEAGEFDAGYENGRDGAIEDVNSALQAILDKDASDTLQACEDAL